MARGNSVAIAATLAGMGAVLGAAQSRPPITFSDVTTRAGITFVHHNGAAGRKFYPELFGGGVAVLDIDGDRWPDLLFVNGQDWPASARDATDDAGGRRARHGLYLNNRDGTFKDVVAASGFDNANVYGLGATVADYDNDGRDDVFMTTVDGGRLFHNAGGGKFADVTARAGLRNAGFTVSAAWLDYDRDGLVDLFIGNYVDWSPGAEVACSQDGVGGYCGPNAYKPVAPALYRNRGGGRFEDVTARAGLDRRHRQGDGCGGARLQLGRMAGRVRRQRPRAGQALSQRRQGTFRRRGRGRRRGAQRERRRSREHGRRRRRLRPVGTAPPVGRQLRERDAGPLSQPRRCSCSSMWRRARRSDAPACCR